MINEPDLNGNVISIRLANAVRSSRAIEPPIGLAERTVAYVLAAGATPSSIANINSDQPVYFGRRRADLLIAAVIGFVVFTLGLTAVQTVRSDAAKLACQKTLRDLHVSLAEYADRHQGRYPAGSHAGDFADELTRAGVQNLPASLACPADSEPRPIGYTYTLGFRSANGLVIGFRKPDPSRQDEDGMPLAADFPTQSSAPVSGLYSPHGNGQNVLFAGGYVRFSKSPLIGLDGDDIYRNRDGRVGAGLTAFDACLGRPDDRP